LSGTKASDIQTKLKLMEEHGIPQMMVLSGSRLAELGRIPHSKEGEAVPAEEALLNRGVLIFVSHRWLQPEKNKPDDESNSKAQALIAWRNWYENTYTKQKDSRHVYFWLDWPSMNQNDLSPYIHSLPLYVASCNDLLCFETPDYNSRAWCSVERVIAYSFMFSGKLNSRPRPPLSILDLLFLFPQVRFRGSYRVVTNSLPWSSRKALHKRHACCLILEKER
jgi:hypothetical protein